MDMKYDRTLLVNFFAGPGTGKSTTMAHCFAELKWRGYDCEMAPEYAKDKVWEGSAHVLHNQFYVSGKQYHRLKRLEGKVQIILTDSPLLLATYYGRKEPKEFRELIIKYHDTFENLNVFLKRQKDYNPNGRLQTLEEAKNIDGEIYNLVGSQKGDFMEVPATRENIQTIVETIEQKYKGEFPF
jgi:uncharacterized protein YaaR (DUF327 family)